MIFAVSVRTARPRNCVVNFPVVQMARSIARTSQSNLHETDSIPPIQSQKEFIKAYPEYVFNHKKQLVAPSDVGPEAMEELYANLSQQLLRCYRTCDGSKVPYMSQLIVRLVLLADMKLWPWHKELCDKYGEEAEEINRTTRELMSATRWAYSIRTKEGLERLLVQYRYQSLVTDEAQFWEACAEGVRACENNKLATVSDEPNTDSQEPARAMPAVYVALTDWINWRFMKIENLEITLSPILSPFPACEEDLKLNPDLTTLLQYLCGAIDLKVQSAEEVKRLEAKVWFDSRKFDFLYR